MLEDIVSVLKKRSTVWKEMNDAPEKVKAGIYGNKLTPICSNHVWYFCVITGVT
jgi:hypothetical protein